jgi:hypothetical protein
VEWTHVSADLLCGPYSGVHEEYETRLTI